MRRRSSPLLLLLPHEATGSLNFFALISIVLVVTVVGAGRGPLVQCVLSASTAVGVPVRVYAVEKNVHAIVTLRNRRITERWDNVTVVHADMRQYAPTELSDLLVSELLGSWGDNELSPECLDGAQRCLREGGVSIPSSYTSFLAPVCSSKLWRGASELLDGKVRGWGRSGGD